MASHNHGLDLCKWLVITMDWIYVNGSISGYPGYKYMDIHINGLDSKRIRI
jgi:hypothetical protein